MNQPNIESGAVVEGMGSILKFWKTGAGPDSSCSKKSAWVRALPVKIEFFNVRYQSLERVELKGSSRQLNEGFA